jgi:LysM repeat protein
MEVGMIEALSMRNWSSGGPPPANGYSVARGDTLSALAARNGVLLETLLQANPQITDPNRIFVGQTVHLPSSGNGHVVRRGETLSAIAGANGTTVDALMRANPEIRNANQIYPGQRVRIAAAPTQAQRPAARPRADAAPTVTRPSGNAPLNASNLNLDPRSVRAADLAERRAGPHSQRLCYRYVKQALQQSGAVNGYLAGGSAIQAGPQLQRQGYVNILNRPGFQIRSAYDAPVGAVLVYSGGQHGHIELRTNHGFASDYASPNARTGAAGNGLSGNGRTLVGVYVLPAQGGLRAPAPANTAVNPATQPPSGNDVVAQLGSIITRGEGNYESYNTGTRGVDGGRVGHSYLHPAAGTVTNRTINEILATDRLSGYNTNRMFAVGKYQITIPTLRAARDAMGLSGNERMTPAMQERIFRDFLLEKAGGGVLADFVLHGRGSVDGAQLAAAKEWASIGVPAGYRNTYGVVSNGHTSYYERAGQNSANSGATDALRNFLTTLARNR